MIYLWMFDFFRNVKGNPYILWTLVEACNGR